MEAFKRVCSGDVKWLARNWLDMGHPIDALLGFAYLPALALAAMEGQVRVVKLLLKRGAGVDVPSQMGITPLKSAAAKGHLEVVKLLLAAGADATARDCSGATAIDSARDRGHTEVLQLLQEHLTIDLDP